jgi:hypothetical protein
MGEDTRGVVEAMQMVYTKIDQFYRNKILWLESMLRRRCSGKPLKKKEVKQENR